MFSLFSLMQAPSLALSDEMRRAVRENYQYRCGYCGVHEEDTGAELTIDHHRPQSHSGGDELENLVYCCSKCNQYKGSYWHETEYIRLLHPQQDDFRAHLYEEPSSELVGKTLEGSFLIQRLHLNRPELTAYRQKKRAEQQLPNELNAALERERDLIRRIEELDAALQAVIEQIHEEVE